MKWQPIETAPKDGTHIRVTGVTLSFGYEPKPPYKPLPWETVAHWFQDGFYPSVSHIAHDHPLGGLTHWKPVRGVIEPVCEQCDDTGQIMATDGTGPWHCYTCDENVCRSCKQEGSKLVCTAGVECVAMSNPASGVLAAATGQAARPLSTSSADAGVSELHQRIMNLPCEVKWASHDVWQNLYAQGHRDARHAAAELVSRALAAPAPTQQPTVVYALRSAEIGLANAASYNVLPSNEQQSVVTALEKVRAALSGAAPAPQPELTDERITQLAQREADEDKHCFIFNKDGRWSVLSFARAIEREVRSLLAASPTQAGEQPVAAGVLVGVPRVQLGPEAFRFTSFREWVNKAQGWFRTRIPEPARSLHRYVAIDTTGRVCLIGADFMRARDEGTFPVAVYLIDTARVPPSDGGQQG